ncbi:hypothetical protein [Mesorhizobium sp. SP-1A]|uniref:hypothetical protein n=1 Tax=Mesorhizobium sp. SP-1A TaxID=3077840 RepID=UPI0028F71337|nr:hypothetical protein [Mesorhizobium sp. SP-1A]
MSETTTTGNRVPNVSNDVASNLSTIMESVKVYRRIYHDALAGLKEANVALTPKFEADLRGLKEIRVSVFVSTLAKAGMALHCRFVGDEEPAVAVSTISKLSSILAAAHDNDEEGLIARRAKMFEPTLVRSINQPGEISMPTLIKICQAANLELFVK